MQERTTVGLPTPTPPRCGRLRLNPSKRHRRALLAGSALALALAGGPSFAFTVIQPTGANYVPMSATVNCGAGKCRTSLDPLTVMDLGDINGGVQNLLAGDLGYQKSAYSIAAIGPQLGIDFTITNYSAANNGSVGGAKLTVAFTAQKGVVLPANLHWVQIVYDNANITGFNGADLTAPKGLGNPESVVDAIGVASPYYDDAFAKEYPDVKARAIPPNFRDIPRRREPTAAVSTIDWTADLFLVSDPGTKMMTVYDAVQWGWVSQYSANGQFNPVPEPASWAIMLAGFGLVGGALRRRRASSSRIVAARM